MPIAQLYILFDLYLQDACPYLLLSANVTRFQLLTACVTSITGRFASWNTTFPLYQSPATRTPEVILEMQMLYDEFFPQMQGIKMFVKYNPNITLTATDYTTLDIHKDADHRTHIARPTIIPGNMQEEQKNVNIRIYTYDPAHIKDKKMPVGVEKIGRKIAIMADKDITPHPDDYKSIEASGSVVWKYVFKPEDLGKKVWIITCFINHTGEEGPWSEPLSFMIY